MTNDAIDELLDKLFRHTDAEDRAMYHAIVAQWAAVELHRNKRWNIEATDDGFRVCRGHHENSMGCDWEYFTPKAQWAAGQTPLPDRLPLPQNEAQAELMMKCGMMWLEQNAPHRLKGGQSQDAERYRWLRGRIAGTIVQRLCTGNQDWRPERMDQLIDAFIGSPSPSK